MLTASSTNSAYNMLQKKPLIVPATYGAVFGCISLCIIIKISRERFVWLDEDESAIFNAHFKQTMPMPKCKKLLDVGRMCTAPPGGEKVIVKGETGVVVLVVSGEAVVRAGPYNESAGNRISRGPGSFVGEAGFLSGETAMADVHLSAGSRFIRWEAAELRGLLEGDGVVRDSVMAMMGLSVAAKLSEGHSRLMEALLEAKRTRHDLREAEYEDVFLRHLLEQLVNGGGGSTERLFASLRSFRAADGVSDEIHTAVLRQLGVDEAAATREGMPLTELANRMLVQAPLDSVAHRRVPKWESKRG